MIKFCNTESYHVHMRTLTEVLDEIENNQILPEGTIFYSKSLPHSINTDFRQPFIFHKVTTILASKHIWQ